MSFKTPVSVLVVIFAEDTGRVLMLQRRDDPDFWQSVTGSLESGEAPYDTALREVKEEVDIDIVAEDLSLVDCQKVIEFEIFAHFRHRYAPDITHNTEHWFILGLPAERQVTLSEHLAWQWVPASDAAYMTKSWSNKLAIEQFIIDAA